MCCEAVLVDLHERHTAIEDEELVVRERSTWRDCFLNDQQLTCLTIGPLPQEDPLVIAEPGGNHPHQPIIDFLSCRPEVHKTTAMIWFQDPVPRKALPL